MLGGTYVNWAVVFGIFVAVALALIAAVSLLIAGLRADAAAVRQPTAGTM